MVILAQRSHDEQALEASQARLPRLSTSRLRSIARGLLGVILLGIGSSSCIPAPDGECSRDADCASSGADFFCAEGLCQGPPLASIDVPAGRFARSASMTVIVHLVRAHGGPASATATLEAGGQQTLGQRQSDGSIQIAAPLSFAPPGTEGMAPFTVVVADDLGHQAQLAGSVLVDDEGPRLTIDPNSVPTTAVVRGAHAILRVLLVDEAPTSLQSAIDSAAPVSAAVQPDGSFRVDLDTAQAPLDASSLSAQLIATDSVGNATHTSVSIPITRLRWRAAGSKAEAIIGLALTQTTVLATTALGGFVIVDRINGMRTETPLPGLIPSGNLATDDVAAYTALNDGRVCKLGLDGTMIWCCAAPYTVAGSIALGPFPAAPPSTSTVSTVIGTSVSDSNLGRFFSVHDLVQNDCEALASPPVARFVNSGPVIAPDGSIYAGATMAAAVGRFDGLAWTFQSYPIASFMPSAQPAFASLPGGGSGQRVLFSNPVGIVDALLFAAPATSGDFPGAPSSVFAAQSSPAGSDATAPAIAEDGTALVATDDPLLAAIAPDGSLRWSTALDGQPATAPVVGAGGTVFAADTKGNLTAFSLADGGVLWSYPVGTAIATSPAVGCDQAIYVGTSQGDIISLAADAPGLANSPWPREGHDVRGTGDARRPLRDLDGGCLE